MTGRVSVTGPLCPSPTAPVPPTQASVRTGPVSGPAGVQPRAEQLLLRVEELESRLGLALDRLARRATQIRELEVRIRELEAQAADGARARAEAAGLRDEIAWRDYVIRDVEALEAAVRARDAEIARLRTPTPAEAPAGLATGA